MSRLRINRTRRYECCKGKTATIFEEDALSTSEIYTRMQRGVLPMNLKNVHYTSQDGFSEEEMLKHREDIEDITDLHTNAEIRELLKQKTDALTTVEETPEELPTEK